MQSITTTYVMKHVKDEDYAQKQQWRLFPMSLGHCLQIFLKSTSE